MKRSADKVIDTTTETLQEAKDKTAKIPDKTVATRRRLDQNESPMP
jgi:hypothetical protein